MSDHTDKLHFTQRPSFVIAVGGLVLTLYFVWAALGAAPTSLSFGNSEPAKPEELLPSSAMSVEVESTASEGMNMGGESSMSVDEFTDLTYRFVDDLSLPDGSVAPTREWSEAMNGANMAAEMAAEGMDAESAGMEAAEPIDVYVIAQRFGYMPNVLRLKKDTQYRFLMMAIDVNHGASIQSGSAGHIMRRPARVLTETVMTFTKTGEFMMYCTVYCGVGHDQMRGKIIVE